MYLGQGTEFFNHLRDRRGMAKSQDLVSPRLQCRFDSRARLIRGVSRRSLSCGTEVAEDLKPQASNQPLRLEQSPMSTNVPPDQNPKRGIEPNDAVRAARSGVTHPTKPPSVTNPGLASIWATSWSRSAIGREVHRSSRNATASRS